VRHVLVEVPIHFSKSFLYVFKSTSTLVFESSRAHRASLPGNMRTAGMIGGLGPESTIDYYRSIIARYRARKPEGGYPHVLINSLDVDKGIAMLDAGLLDDLADYLAVAMEPLARAGADFGFIAANTPHLVFDEVQHRRARHLEPCPDTRPQ
jgi:hypothetical protein